MKRYRKKYRLPLRWRLLRCELLSDLPIHAAILLGLAAVLTAFAAYRASLTDDSRLSGAAHRSSTFSRLMAS